VTKDVTDLGAAQDESCIMQNIDQMDVTCAKRVRGFSVKKTTLIDLGALLFLPLKFPFM
jgi:hypothetical protein